MRSRHRLEFVMVPPLQAIIGNYAVPVLEEKQVWGTSDQTKTAYLDSQVCAACTSLLTLRSPLCPRAQRGARSRRFSHCRVPLHGTAAACLPSGSPEPSGRRRCAIHASQTARSVEGAVLVKHGCQKIPTSSSYACLEGGCLAECRMWRR